MRSSSSEHSARAERLRALTLGRAAIAALLLGGLSTVGRSLVMSDAWALLSATGVGYSTLLVVTLLLPRRFPGTIRPLVELGIVVDVVALGVVLAATGGVHSPLLALLLTEVVAVTLLFGRWAGLRSTALNSVAVVWLLTVTPATLFDPVVDPAVVLGSSGATRGALLLATLWVTAAITGYLSNVTERELRGRTEDLSLLREVTPDLDPRQGPERVAQAVTEVVVDRLGHAAAGLWLPDREEPSTSLTLVGSHGTRSHPSLQDQPRDLPADHDLFPDAGRPTIRSVRPDEPRPAALGAVCGPDAGVLLVPLHLDGRHPGLLAIGVRGKTSRRSVLRPRQLRMLRMLCEQATLLLDNARLQAELADQATRDAVTGLPNHRFFQQRLGEELDRVSRRAEHGEERAVSLALLDLDRFKAVNDTYGHPTGDRVLAAVGRAATDALRETDVVCRYGGEEFAVVLVDTDEDDALVVVERLRQAIRQLTLDATDGRRLGPITASAGVVTVRGERATRATVVDHADTALYAAKRTGRDRAVHHRDLPLVSLDDTTWQLQPMPSHGAADAPAGSDPDRSGDDAGPDRWPGPAR